MLLKFIYCVIECYSQFIINYINYSSAIFAVTFDLGMNVHVMWVPCHHGMARPQVADGEGLQIWRAAANILNKQSRTADKGWPSSLVFGRGANNSPP
jgi:hypothetical protein